MKQKGMSIILAVLLAAGTAAPVYAEEIFSIEAVYVGESQNHSSQSSNSEAPNQQKFQPTPTAEPTKAVTVRVVSKPQKVKVVIPKKEDGAKPALSEEAEPEKNPSEQEDFPYTLESFAEEVLRLTNKARAEAGAPPLETDPVLSEMAQARKDKNNKKMTHIRPDGTTADTIFKEYDTGLTCTGEIIISTCSSPEAVVNGFLSSPAHKKNMLNPDHKYAGIGVSWGETPAGKGIAVLELFAK
jgi:uncharacterized protein YkwD